MKTDLRSLIALLTHLSPYTEYRLVYFFVGKTVRRVDENEVYSRVDELIRVLSYDPFVVGSVIAEIRFRPVVGEAERTVGDRFYKSIPSAGIIRRAVVVNLAVSRVRRDVVPEKIEYTDLFIGCPAGFLRRFSAFVVRTDPRVGENIP